jgi:uncharacterized protein
MSTQPTPSSPWWKHGFVWLIIAGPVAVILAGIVTISLAVQRPDPVVEADYYRRGMEINKTLAARDKANLPALQGRNHAATPTTP